MRPTRILAGLSLLAIVSSAFAQSSSVTYNVQSSFAASDTAGPKDFTTRIKVCEGDMTLKSVAIQIDCMKFFVSPDAQCTGTNQASVSCVLSNGTSFVTLQTSDITFACDGPCLALPADSACSQPGNFRSVDGYKNPSTSSNKCYANSQCLYQEQESVGSFSGFGSYCPSSSGDFCCGSDVTVDTSYFVGLVALDAGLTYNRAVSHITNMDIDISFDVLAPAQLQITVEVPYVTGNSKVTIEEYGVNTTYDMCPSTYMIDFEDPIETEPNLTVLQYGVSRGAGVPWLPMKFTGYTADALGTPRSSCGNYNFNYNSDSEFKTDFTFQIDEAPGTLAYGNTPVPDTSVWDDTGSKDGIPSGSNNFWTKSEPFGVVGSGNRRVNYTAGHFDLLKTFHKCIDYKTRQKLVSKKAESGSTFINGVAYPVETYDFTLSVCQVGFFGQNCKSTSVAQMYSKTCKKQPVSFSIGPQQVSHVTSTPVTAGLVSKTFLQSVKSIKSTCGGSAERLAITVNLVFLSRDYTIKTDELVHDIISPENVFQSGVQENIGITPILGTITADEFIEGTGGIPNTRSEGIYAMSRYDESLGGVDISYQKLVVLTKCYNTGFNQELGTRSTPEVFADAAAEGTDQVKLDFEIILQRNVTVGGVVTDQAVRNTLNVRILGTKETFVLPSAEALKQKDVTAVQKIYGDYASAKSDVAVGFGKSINGTQPMFGGDQLCSKHQIVGYDRQVALLTPNAVGSCMLTQAGVNHADAVGTLMAGKSVFYKGLGMAQPAPYVFGCFTDWLDVSALSPTITAAYPAGVYIFGTTITRKSATHQSAFWFVAQEKLNDQPTGGPGSETFDKRFGTGLFYYNSTLTYDKAHVALISDEMQLTPADQKLKDESTFAELTAGCETGDGILRGSCNLVCFDIVDGLLTDPDGVAARTVLVHHISVATIALEDQSTSDKKFPNAVTTRRQLLQTVSSVPLPIPGAENSPTGTSMFQVKPKPRAEVGATPPATEVGATTGTPATGTPVVVATPAPAHVGRDAIGKNAGLFWAFGIILTLAILVMFWIIGKQFVYTADKPERPNKPSRR